MIQLEPSPALLSLGGWTYTQQPRIYYRPHFCPVAFTAREVILLAPTGRVSAHCDPIFDPDFSQLPLSSN